MVVAEQRTFPPAERVESNGDGDRNIYANHSRFHTTEKTLSRIAVAGKYRSTIAVLVRIHQSQGVIETFPSHDRQYGPEDPVANQAGSVFLICSLSHAACMSA